MVITQDLTPKFPRPDPKIPRPDPKIHDPKIQAVNKNIILQDLTFTPLFDKEFRWAAGFKNSLIALVLTRSWRLANQSSHYAHELPISVVSLRR